MLHCVDLPNAEVYPFVTLQCLRHKCELRRVHTQGRKPKGGTFKVVVPVQSRQASKIYN
jgi:hypothetical protein